MIDRPALVAWRSKAPWPNPVQIEQDPLLSRLIEYDPGTAADLVMHALGSRLRNAPPDEEIRAREDSNL